MTSSYEHRDIYKMSRREQFEMSEEDPLEFDRQAHGLHRTDWPTLTLVGGILLDQDKEPAGNFPKFETVDQAQAYLEEHDIRGTVR